jgi:hypothetical protein
MVSMSDIGGNRKHHTQKTKPNNCGEVAIYSNYNGKAARTSPDETVV